MNAYRVLFSTILISLFFTLFVQADFGGYNESVPVVMYHKISNNPDECNEYCISSNTLENDFNQYKRAGFTPISISEFIMLSDAVKSICNFGLSDKLSFEYAQALLNKYPNPLLITFDDGYVDGYDIVFPLLKKYNFKASFFIVGMYSSNVGTGFLSDTQIREMADSGLAEFGNHTFSLHEMTQSDITKLMRSNDSVDQAKIYDDITKNNALVMKWANKQILSFSYPYGISSKYADAITSGLGIKVSFVTNASSRFPKLGESMFNLSRINRSCLFTSRGFTIRLIDTLYAQTSLSTFRKFNFMLHDYKDFENSGATGTLQNSGEISTFFPKHKLSVLSTLQPVNLDYYINNDNRAILRVDSVGTPVRSENGRYTGVFKIQIGGRSIFIDLENGTATYNNNTFIFPVVLQNYIPVRDVFEFAGFSVNYNSSTKELTIF